MEILVKAEKLLQNKKFVFLVFFIFISFQVIYSFLSPAYPDSYYWKKVIDLDSYKGYTFGAFDNSFIQKIYPLIDNYRMNLDAGGYLLLAHDFPQHYFKGNYTFLTRPLYPILINLAARPLHFISNSYSLTFAAGLAVNFILFFITVLLFYILVKKLISLRVAFLSSILLIFSPFAHIWLTQPETDIFGLFFVIVSLYLLYDYLNKPSFGKLIIFSLALGILLLGKKLFAISIFILLLSFLFRRFKEGIIFFTVHLTPLIFWSFWISKVWGLNIYVDEVSNFGLGVWFFNIFRWPWQQTFKIFIDSVPGFILSVIYGFLLFPVIFAIFGFKDLSFERKNIFCISFIFSFFTLFFMMNYYAPRHGFLLFPLIYPLTVLGIDRLAEFLRKYKKWYSPVFYFLVFAFLIIISLINIYDVFDYGGDSPWLNKNI